MVRASKRWTHSQKKMTLYVAKVGAGFSLDPTAAAAPLTWIRLGSASSAEIKRLATTLKPTDIMSVKTTDPLDATYTRVAANGRIKDTDSAGPFDQT